jgi:hypothetical protein
LKNIGTVEVIGTVVDSSGSAALRISIKDFHAENNSHTRANKLGVGS